MDGESATKQVSTASVVDSVLDELIGRLAQGPESPERAAILIEARRLRQAAQNWSAVPPTEEVRSKFLARVMELVAMSRQEPGK